MRARNIIEAIRRFWIRRVVRRAGCYGESPLIKCIHIIKQEEFIQKQLEIIKDNFR